MRAEALLTRIEQGARRLGLEVESEPLAYRAGPHRLVELRSPGLHASERVLLVQAGIHGDEVAGPLAFAEHLDRIVDAVHGCGLALLAYPLANPSGFEGGTRYNGDHDAGPEGNSDFLRYELADGRFASELPAGATYRAIAWSSERPGSQPLPLETVALQRRLRRAPLSRVVAALDLHQDRLTPGLPPCAYHYAFGDLARYGPIVEAIDARVPVLRGVPIGAGFGVRIDALGRVTAPSAPDADRTTDAGGFIVRHDGSFSDLFHRLGVPHSVTSETSGATPLALACEVALLWVEGLARLASEP